MIEEYKVSLFAQELKTPFPISRKRLDARMGEIERML
jgi:ATP-dependent helicase HrpA